MDQSGSALEGKFDAHDLRRVGNNYICASISGRARCLIFRSIERYVSSLVPLSNWAPSGVKGPTPEEVLVLAHDRSSGRDERFAPVHIHEI